MKRIFVAITILLLMASCRKEKISLGTNVSETFYFDNNRAAMRVLVEGNTASKTFLVFVHGGPGASSYIYNTDYIKNNIANKYTCVFWDQRNAGASQGNSNSGSLNLDQMTDDLKKLLLILKSRYGDDIEIFLLGHSFGGLLTSSFMTAGDNQSLIKGWIFADGSHNYPLNDTLTRQKLLTVGLEQLALDKHYDDWTIIVDYCNAHTGNFTFDESMQLESYANDAETYLGVVKQTSYATVVEDNAINDDWPITSILFNDLYSADADINKELAKTQFTTTLYRVITPVLIIYGENDFVCPKEMGDDVFNHIGSTDKRMAISPISGHDIFLEDESFFCSEVDAFIEQHR